MGGRREWSGGGDEIGSLARRRQKDVPNNHSLSQGFNSPIIWQILFRQKLSCHVKDQNFESFSLIKCRRFIGEFRSLNATNLSGGNRVLLRRPLPSPPSEGRMPGGHMCPSFPHFFLPRDFGNLALRLHPLSPLYSPPPMFYVQSKPREGELN